jgi:threonine dehydratase
MISLTDVCFSHRPVIRDLVSAVVTVDDDEPSGAIGLAVILSDKFKNEVRTNLENIGIVLSGGNAGLKLC